MEKKEIYLSDLEDKDIVIKTIFITDTIRARLISNKRGFYVDLRKYYGRYPTKKGVRLLMKELIDIIDSFKEDTELIYKNTYKLYLNNLKINNI